VNIKNITINEVEDLNEILREYPKKEKVNL